MATQFEHAVDFGDGRVLRHHGRVHALLDAAFGPECDAEQLDAIAEIVGRLDIGGRDRSRSPRYRPTRSCVRVPKARLVSSASLCAVSKPPMSKVGIGLGIALRLRLLQHVGEGPALALHQRQDVVAGAVEDAVDAADVVALQALAHDLDDGNAAGHRASKLSATPFFSARAARPDP